MAMTERGRGLASAGRYRIRPERPDDRAAVHAVHRAAFGGPAEADLVDALRGAQPWLSFVAEDPAGGAGGVVGHVLLSRVDVGGDPALGLAPLGVLPAHQRAGVGTALTRAALAAAADAGERLVVVLGDPEFYRRFGFLPASRYGVSGPFPVPDHVFQALALPGGGRAPRGAVTYPPPFMRL
jgi:putative acetyltransferase